MYDIEEIKKKLESHLSAKRYTHTIGVAYTAAALAMRYNADMDKALLAGLLHDCAKEYKADELIQKCKRAGISLNSDELSSPQIIHAIYGEYMARERYNITDKDILGAIRWHTTGKKDMSLLEKIIFTADYIEPGRCEADNLSSVRPLAFDDITRAVYEISKDTVDYLSSKSRHIDKHTIECYRYLEENYKVGEF